jgi:hypothetical protein
MHVRLKFNCSTLPEVLMVVLGSMTVLSILARQHDDPVLTVPAGVEGDHV